jgi:hypothetical protein
MDTPTNPMPDYYEFVSTIEDDAKALDEACAFAMAQPWILTAVILKEKLDGKHIFNIIYNKK